MNACRRKCMREYSTQNASEDEEEIYIMLTTHKHVHCSVRDNSANAFDNVKPRKSAIIVIQPTT